MLSRNIQKKLFMSLLRIRLAEEVIVDVYAQRTMKTPTHLSIGQEAVAVGVCAALNADDQVFVSHRCHAAYLAKKGCLDGFFAELCGRATGSNQGRAGSAHLSDARCGIFTSPILGGMIPVAAGAALSFQMDRTRQVAVAFFGDAAIEEGAFAETVNFAMLKRLPLVFVCENNLYSTHTHIRDRQPGSAIFRRVRVPGFITRHIDGNDVEAVYFAACQAAQLCRRGRGPVFLECSTYRFREHVGPLYDYDQGYRTKKEVESWQKKCPILRYGRKLIRRKTFTQKQIDDSCRMLKNQSNVSYQQALKSPWPDPRDLLRWVS